MTIILLNLFDIGMSVNCSCHVIVSPSSVTVLLIGDFHGAWVRFRRARVGSGFSAAVCKIQASKCYIVHSADYLQLPLDRIFALLK